MVRVSRAVMLFSPPSVPRVSTDPAAVTVTLQPVSSANPPAPHTPSMSQPPPLAFNVAATVNVPPPCRPASTVMPPPSDPAARPCASTKALIVTLPRANSSMSPPSRPPLASMVPELVRFRFASKQISPPSPSVPVPRVDSVAVEFTMRSPRADSSTSPPAPSGTAPVAWMSAPAATLRFPYAASS